MDFIDKLVLNHVMHNPTIALAIAAVYVHIDHIVAFLLKTFSKDQIERAIDAGAGLAKAEVEKVAGEEAKKDVPHA